ncbi:MAG: helix-turn-helix domain-containing protein [Acidobacteriota bacterium]
MALWRVEEAAEYLGIRPKTLYEWVRTGRVPHRKLGFNVRFEPDELRAWVEAQAEGEEASAPEDEAPAGAGRRDLEELREAATEAVDMLRRLETDLGAHLTFPRRQALRDVLERLRDALAARAED